MKNKVEVPIKNLHFKDLQVLIEELDIFTKYAAVTYLATDLLNTVIIFDTIMGLIYKLSVRVANGHKDYYTINFSVTEAAIILKCCNFNRTDRYEYTKHLMSKLKINLDQQLINLV